MSEKPFFRCFFGFQLEAKCVAKNDGFPYWFCVVVILVSCWFVSIALCVPQCALVWWG